MKKLLFLFCFALATVAFAQPANDVCTGAISFGTLGAPGACGSGIKKGATSTLAATNVNATPENPYSYQSGCSALPANTVWYSFTAPANGFGVTISVSGSTGTLNNPQISLWTGTCAGGFAPMGCIGGAAGTATLSVAGVLVPGTTYYFTISGDDVTESGTFTLKVNAFQDCSDCLNAGHITANPLPVNGMYQPGQTVNFCFHVDQWTQANFNYLHGVQMSFGAGWDVTTLTTTAPPTYYSSSAFNTNCSGSCGNWAYYPGGCTSSASGVHYGPGFYHDGSYSYNLITGVCSCQTNPGNPGSAGLGGGDGSSDAGSGGVLIPPANEWNFCWTIKVLPGCNPGNPLTVTVTTTGDGQSGDYTSAACSGNQPVFFNAVQACCPPNVSATGNVSCFGGSDGVATATAVVGTAGNQNPYIFTWSNSGGTVATHTVGSGTTDNANGLPAGNYTVTVVDQNLCSSTSTLTVSQPTAVTATATPTNANCTTGGSINGSASGGNGGYNYAWSGPSGYSSSSQNISGLNTGTYTLTVTDSKNCTFSTTATVNQTGSATAAFSSSSTSQCLPTNSFTFTNTGSGGATYNWDYGDAATGTGTPVTHTYASVGTYIITETVTLGSCTNTITHTVTVNSLPNPGVPTSGAQLTCTTLTTTVNDPVGGMNYSWSGPGIVAGGSTATATVNAAGVYTVTVTDPSTNCSSTATATVTTNNSVPTATATAGAAITCNTATTTVTGGSGTPGVTYSWNGPGIVSGGSTTTPTVNASGVYTLTVTDPGTSCTAVTTATVAVNNTPPSPVASAGPQITCGNLTTTVTTTPASGVTYNWSGPGIVSGGTTATPTVNAAGIYTVTVTDNSNGCSNTDTAMVSSNGAVPTVTATPAGPLTCTVNTTSINSTTNPSSGVTYSWSGPGIISGGTTGTVTVNAAGVYTITVTDQSSGCSGTSSATVTLNGTLPQPTATAGPQLTCTVTTTTLNATPSSGVSYNWSGPGIVSGGNTATPTVNAAGVYTVTVTDNTSGCSNTDTATVLLNNTPPSLTVTAGPQLTCTTLSTTVSASPAGFSYSWSGPGIASGGTTTTPTVNAPGSYSVTVTDPSNGCTSTSSAAVALNNMQPNASTSNAQIPCGSTTVTLTGSSTTPGAGFSWNGPGIVSGGGTSTPMVNASGSYTLTVTDPNNGCTNSTAIASVSVTPSPTITGTPVADSANCGAINGGFTGLNVTGGTPGYTYNWTNASGATAGTSLNLTGVGPGSYTLTVTDTNLCTATMSGASLVVPGNPAVTAAFTPSPSQGTVPLTVVLTNNSTGATQYLWSFGDGTGAVTSNPSVIYGTAGIYTITLIASNGSCNAMDTAVIIVDDATSIIIPNVFSPNGDAINDEFIITCTGIKTLHCDIFNRWGQSVYTLQSYNQNWDGKLNNGNQATEGTYYFILNALGADGKTYEKRGTITLVK